MTWTGKVTMMRVLSRRGFVGTCSLTAISTVTGMTQMQCFVFEVGSGHAAQDGIYFVILLPQLRFQASANMPSSNVISYDE